MADEQASGLIKKINADPNMKKVFAPFSKNEKHQEKFVRQAYEQSLMPAKDNPTDSPAIIYEMYPFIFGENGFIAKSLGKSINSEEAEVYKERIRSSINSLTQTILELEMKLKTHPDKNYNLKNKSSLSSFQHSTTKGEPDGERESANKAVELARYVRLTIQTFIYTSLKPVFETTKKDVENIVAKSKVPDLTYSVLHNRETRVSYVKQLAQFFLKK